MGSQYTVTPQAPLFMRWFRYTLAIKEIPLQARVSGNLNHVGPSSLVGTRTNSVSRCTMGSSLDLRFYTLLDSSSVIYETVTRRIFSMFSRPFAMAYHVLALYVEFTYDSFISILCQEPREMLGLQGAVRYHHAEVYNFTASCPGE